MAKLKTDWKLNDIVMPEHMNETGKEVNRLMDDVVTNRNNINSVTATANTNKDNIGKLRTALGTDDDIKKFKAQINTNKDNIDQVTSLANTNKTNIEKVTNLANTNKTNIENNTNEIVKIKELQKGNDIKVETHESYKNIENTITGYVENHKLYGKTLINLNKEPFTSYLIDKIYRVRTFNIKNTVPANTKIYLGINVISMKFSKYGLRLQLTNVDGTNTYLPFTNTIGEQYISITTVKETRAISLYFTTEEIEADETVNALIEKFTICLQPINNLFEGMQSAGEDIDKMSVLTCTGNLILKSNIINGGLNWADGEYNPTTVDRCCIENYIPIRDNVTIYRNVSTAIFFYDNDKKLIMVNNPHLISYLNTPCPVPNNAKYIRAVFHPNLGADPKLVLGKNPVFSYDEKLLNVEYRETKKDILYKDDNGVYKPVNQLRGIDYTSRSLVQDIIDFKENKYEINTNIYIMTGDENFNLLTDIGTDIARAWISKSNLTVTPKKNATKIDTWVNKIWTENKEPFIAFDDNSNLAVGIYKTDLSSLNNAGFKKFFKDKFDSGNPCIVLYETDTTKSYELQETDELKTYEGSTNYFIESGAIAPLSTFEASAHIADVLLNVKDKVDKHQSWYLEEAHENSEILTNESNEFLVGSGINRNGETIDKSKEVKKGLSSILNVSASTSTVGTVGKQLALKNNSLKYMCTGYKLDLSKYTKKVPSNSNFTISDNTINTGSITLTSPKGVNWSYVDYTYKVKPHSRYFISYDYDFTGYGYPEIKVILSYTEINSNALDQQQNLYFDTNNDTEIVIRYLCSASNNTDQTVVNYNDVKLIKVKQFCDIDLKLPMLKTGLCNEIENGVYNHRVETLKLSELGWNKSSLNNSGSEWLIYYALVENNDISTYLDKTDDWKNIEANHFVTVDRFGNGGDNTDNLNPPSNQNLGCISLTKNTHDPAEIRVKINRGWVESDSTVAIKGYLEKWFCYVNAVSSKPYDVDIASLINVEPNDTLFLGSLPNTNTIHQVSFNNNSKVIATESNLSKINNQITRLFRTKFLDGSFSLQKVNGYIRLPKFLGNFMLQWGIFKVEFNNDTVLSDYVYFTRKFDNECFGAFTQMGRFIANPTGYQSSTVNVVGYDETDSRFKYELTRKGEVTPPGHSAEIKWFALGR